MIKRLKTWWCGRTNHRVLPGRLASINIMPLTITVRYACRCRQICLYQDYALEVLGEDGLAPTVCSCSKCNELVERGAYTWPECPKCYLNLDEVCAGTH